MSIDSEAVSIVSIQSIKYAKSNKPLIILNNTSYIKMAKSVLADKMPKLIILGLARMR